MNAIELFLSLCVCAVMALLGRLLIGPAGVLIGLVPAMLLCAILAVATVWAGISRACRRGQDK